MLPIKLTAAYQNAYQAARQAATHWHVEEANFARQMPSAACSCALLPGVPPEGGVPCCPGAQAPAPKSSPGTC